MKNIYWSLGIYISIIAISASCSSTKEIQQLADVQYRTDTLRIYQQRIDSVYFKDSIFVNQYRQGDTVFVTQYEERTKWRLQKDTDTIYVSKTDTVTRNEYIETTVEKTSLWHDVKIAICTTVILTLLFLFIVLKIDK